jgi:hypothetical protein
MLVCLSDSWLNSQPSSKRTGTSQYLALAAKGILAQCTLNYIHTAIILPQHILFEWKFRCGLKVQPPLSPYLSKSSNGSELWNSSSTNTGTRAEQSLQFPKKGRGKHKTSDCRCEATKQFYHENTGRVALWLRTTLRKYIHLRTETEPVSETLCDFSTWKIQGRWIQSRIMILIRKYRLFRKELYNFENLYTSTQRTWTVSWTVIV